MAERLRARLRRQDGEDSGFTLIELLVVMTVLAVVMSVITGVLISISKDTQKISQRTDAIDQARLAIQTIDRQVRSGNVLFNPASDTDATAAAMWNPSNKQWQMRIYTQANGVEKCVQWVVSGGVLEMRSWTPTWQTDGQVTAWQVVARDIVNTSSQTPFLLRGGGSTSAYGARLLDINLYTQVTSVGGQPVLVADSLSGRNTVYGYDTGICSPVPSG